MERNTTILQLKRQRHQRLYPICLHVEEGRIQTPKICIRDYECWHCGFDQWLEQMEMHQAKDGSLRVAGTILAKAA
ncbi:MAG: hypothetical protein V1689_04465 [Pseudomonadota bacterium]